MAREALTGCESAGGSLDEPLVGAEFMGFSERGNLSTGEGR